MKAIKLTADNTAAIHAALEAVNGKAIQHTYSAREVLELVPYFENKLVTLVGSKKLAPGAKASSRSGGALPNAYKYSRTVTDVEIERRSSAWYLVSVSSATAYKEAGKDLLKLTTEQDATAVANFRKQYFVMRPASEVTA
jgi:hypothetical protein